MASKSASEAQFGQQRMEGWVETSSIADAIFTLTQQRVYALLSGQPNRPFFVTEIIEDDRSHILFAQALKILTSERQWTICLCEHPGASLPLAYARGRALLAKTTSIPTIWPRMQTEVCVGMRQRMPLGASF